MGAPLAHPVAEDAAQAIFRTLVLPHLEAALGSEIFSSWFARLRLERLEGSTVRLSVPTRFLKSWIEAHYGDQLRAALRIGFSDVLLFDLAVRSAARPAAPKPVPARSFRPSDPPTLLPKAARPSPRVRIVRGPLDPLCSFARYQVSESNRLAHQAVTDLALSVRIGEASCLSPLTLVGPTGCGKSHLAFAAAAAVRAGGRDGVAIDPLRLTLLAAGGDDGLFAALDDVGRADLIVLDDIHEMRGERALRLLDRLIRERVAGCRALIATSVVPLHDLERLSADVRSRLAGGLSAPIAGPDIALRLALLDECVASLAVEAPGFSLAPEVREALARLMVGAREVRGAAVRLLALHRTGIVPMSAEALMTQIPDLIGAPPVKTIRIELIQRVVADAFDVRLGDMISVRRTAKVVRPRQIAMYLSKTLTPRSLPEIGRRFGGRDHTTILHAVRKIDALKADDPELRATLATLAHTIEDRA